MSVGCSLADMKNGKNNLGERVGMGLARSLATRWHWGDEDARKAKQSARARRNGKGKK